jgi:hypothetical protein
MNKIKTAMNMRLSFGRVFLLIIVQIGGQDLSVKLAKA